MAMENIEKRNKEILTKISEEDAQFLMEQAVVRQMELFIDNIYDKDLLNMVKSMIDEKLSSK